MTQVESFRAKEKNRYQDIDQYKCVKCNFSKSFLMPYFRPTIFYKIGYYHFHSFMQIHEHRSYNHTVGWYSLIIMKFTFVWCQSQYILSLLCKLIKNSPEPGWVFDGENFCF